MEKANRFYQSVDLTFNHDCLFKEPEAQEFENREGKYSVTLLFLEIKSDVPPTDTFLKIVYSTANNNALQPLNVDLIKYRKQFIYENGYYVLYFDEIDEIKSDIIPLKFKITDRRNPAITAKLFYEVKLSQQ